MYNSLEPLRRDHDTSSFISGSDAQDRWLREFAQHNMKPGTALRIFVVTTTAAPSEVIAYFAWCMSSVKVEHLPERLSKGAGRHPQPFALLAQMAVDERHAGNGLGTDLVWEALYRTNEISEQIGCRGMLIHVGNDNAREFYSHRFPDMQEMPRASDEDLPTLVAMTKDIPSRS